MKNNVSKLQWTTEILWTIAIIILVSFLVWDIYPVIERFLFYYIVGTMLLSFTYLRWILFPRSSPFMRMFWFKVIIMIINVPIALFTIRYFMNIMEIFDSFDFSQGIIDGQLILEGTALEFIQKTRELTIASASSLVILTILFVFRSIQLIFKWREIPFSTSK